MIDKIKKANHIVFLTGYEISAYSNFPDIRKSTYMIHDFYIQKPEEFFTYLRTEVVNRYYVPNIIHQFIAKLQIEKDVTVITENVDGLHKKAGSMNCIELYGSIEENICQSCFKEYSANTILYSKNRPTCSCKGFIKPSITLSGEPVNGEKVMEAVNALLVADLLIIVGSNLSIHPTPYLLQFYHGNNIITLNNSTHNLEDLFKDLYEKI
ncbi:MAG: hypothetical protein HUJ53_05510 [Holdemanella sp.]|nr:hypothetical protein [Holdemanella sp.]